MAVRWIVCPVVEWPPNDPDDSRAEPTYGPKVGIIVEPGRGKPYQFSAALAVGGYALCFVRAQDFSALDSDQQCVNVLERDYEDGENFLAATPRQLGWNTTRRRRLEKILADRGVDISGLTVDSPLWQWLERLGKHVSPSFTPAGTWVRG